MTDGTYQERLGSRLRAIRGQQGLTLHDVEERSAGTWKAVVVGSYERGDRAVSVSKLAKLAKFYGVPIADLLPVTGPVSTTSADFEGTAKIIVDLGRLGTLPESATFDVVRRYVTHVQRDRGDYNGQVITLREQDLRSIAAACDEDSDVLINELTAVGALR